jgi:hypothetical protein
MEGKKGVIDTTTQQKSDPMANDSEMVIESSEDLEVVKSFDDLGIREELLRGN